MIPEDLTKGIVQILRHDDTVAGTGFLVSNSLIATCAHVIQATDPGPGKRVRVCFYLNGKECNAIVMPERWHDPYNGDFSILQLEDELPSDVKALSLCSSAGVIGHKVCTFGFPVIGEIKGIWGHGDYYSLLIFYLYTSITLYGVFWYPHIVNDKSTIKSVRASSFLKGTW